MTNLIINGRPYNVDPPDDTPLLLGCMTSWGSQAEFGCGISLCGACTEHVDGQPTRSCITSISAAANKKVTTIEAIGTDKIGKAVQAAWVELGVPQCGYCQGGQIMAATALLKQKPTPTDADIDEAMAGNICRCGTYTRIRAAIKQAAGPQGAKT